jgi:hypothetical protein
MRKSLWLMLAVMVVAVSAPNAHADTVYAIAFSGPGAPTVVGSDLLDYNSTLFEFTAPTTLEIMFDGQDITLANSLTGFTTPGDTIEWFTEAGNFYIYDTFSGVLFAGPDTGSFGAGSVMLAAQTPEPSSVALMLLGASLVLLRKRNSRGHQLAT